jgi:acyl-coenzyme A thioesterase PaaI-like protein
LNLLTHLGISPTLVGVATALESGRASATLTTLPEMAADAQGLVHGGFVFGLADYAAMLAVNDPYVVLGGADCRFLAPVRVGEILVAEAVTKEVAGKKRLVECSVRNEREAVFSATFTCFVLPRHVLER